VIAAASVERIHSETVTLLARAAASTFFRSSAFNRTGTMDDFASPLGNFGRPGLRGLGWVKAAKLLNDCGSHGGLWRHGGRYV
jgi:hypothetical protein